MLLIIAFYTFYRRAGADADCRQAHSGRPRRRQMGRGPTPLVVGAEDGARDEHASVIGGGADARRHPGA